MYGFGVGTLLVFVMLALVLGPFGTLFYLGLLVLMGLAYRIWRNRR